jgi:2-hydroxychromene-2-carboxylate isomerase
MGEVISLDDRREARRVRGEAPAGAGARVEFLFDLGDPFTYLAAERVERAFSSVAWIPADGSVLRGGAPWSAGELDRLCAAAERRADALRLPLAWPDRWPADVPEAMRVAHHAAERGRGPAFVLSAARMAFGGGFDLRDPDTLVDAAAAAGLDGEECLRAAREERRDAAIRRAARQLLTARVTRVPALRVEGAVFAGEGRIAEAAASARASAASA